MSIKELDYNLTLIETGIQTSDDNNAMNARIYEWFDTPVHSMANNVRWGHPLRQFQFDPTSGIMDIEMEMVIAQKIRQDIDGIKLKYIRVEIGSEIDSILVFMVHSAGTYQDQIQFGDSANG